VFAFYLDLILVCVALCPHTCPSDGESSKEGLCVDQPPNTGIHPFRYIFRVKEKPFSLL